jgi:hypothetical protein
MESETKGLSRNDDSEFADSMAEPGSDHCGGSASNQGMVAHTPP